MAMPFLFLFAFRYIMNVLNCGGLYEVFKCCSSSKKMEYDAETDTVFCREGRIEGAQRVGKIWIIPENAEKPANARKKKKNRGKCVNTNISIERVWAMPNKNTFDIKPIRDLITEELTDGLWIDPFANQNKLAAVTNDLSLEFDTDYHLDALDFIKMFDSNAVDGVLYDPPYSPRQVSECYNKVGYDVTWDTTKASFWGNHKREISRVVKIGGKVITFGWNSGGIGYKYGFEIKRILLVPHGGWHNDTICTVEIKTYEGEILESREDADNILQKTSNNILTQKDQKLIAALNSLPRDFWDFKESDVREYTHGIHNYPAMMVCPISRNIIKLVKEVQNVETVLDSFMGSGTVLVESMLAGVNNIYGSDINPLAIYLSKVKTTRLDMNLLQQTSKALYRQIEDVFSRYAIQINRADEIMRSDYKLDLTAKKGWSAEASKHLLKYTQDNEIDIDVPDFKNIGYWFKPRVILLLSLIKREINRITERNIRDFVFVAFSETIRFVSNRRNGEFKMFRMPSNRVETFEPDVIEEFTAILNRNIEKMDAFDKVCADTGINPSISIFKNYNG